MLNSKRFLPYFTIGEIPTSYLDSMTYLEQILCINAKLTEIIKYLDEFSEDNIEKMIDEKIDNLQNYIDSQDEKLYNNIKNYVDSNLNNLINELTALINQKFNFLLEYINNNDNLIRLEVKQQIDELKQQIDDIIIKGINVYDPTTGKMNNIQDVVFNLYKYLRYYGITALNFDTLGLTVSEFEEKKLTAREFDLYSKCKLEIDLVHNMFSPFTGEIEPLQNIITTLANFHKNELTAQEFDDLNLTAEQFDSKNITAYDFDFNGKNLLTA